MTFPLFYCSTDILTLPNTEVDKFLSGHPILWAGNFICAPNRARRKMGAQNQSAPPIETQLEKLLFALYYLNSTCSFHF